MNAEPTHGRENPRNFGYLEITILLLSVYVLAALLVQTCFQLPPEVHVMLNWIDAFVCVVFLFDFVVRFHRAPSKLAYMKWGWIDLLSSIPQLDPLRWGRLVRVIRIIRAFRSARQIMAFLYRKRSQNLALVAVLTAFILVCFSCIAVLSFEDGESSNIRTPFDAVWWAMTTMTTVGYGDMVPVTVEGKSVAIVLMVTGVGLFGVLTGLFARFFVEPGFRREESEIDRLAREVRLLREKVEVLTAGPERTALE